MNLRWMRFERIMSNRPTEPVANLARRIRRLLAAVGDPFGAPGLAVSGGSVTRALLGQAPPPGVDLDLLVPDRLWDRTERELSRFGDLMPVSGSGGAKYATPVGAVDAVRCRSVADAVCRFDFRACAIATDGETMVAVDGAIVDLQRRWLHFQRPSVHPRVDKYLAMGLDFDPTQVQDGDAVAGALVKDSFASRDEALGLKADIGDLVWVPDDPAYPAWAL